MHDGAWVIGGKYGGSKIDPFIVPAQVLIAPPTTDLKGSVVPFGSVIRVLVFVPHTQGMAKLVQDDGNHFLSPFISVEPHGRFTGVAVLSVAPDAAA